MNMFDPPIRHPQSILLRIILPVFRCALDDLPEAANVFRVNSLVDEFHRRHGLPPVLEDPEGLRRPVDSSAGRSPSKTARLTQSLSLSQIDLAAPQILFSLPACAIFDGQFAIEMGVLERDRCL